MVPPVARALAMFGGLNICMFGGLNAQLAAGGGEEVINLSQYLRKRLLRIFRQELRSFNPFTLHQNLFFFGLLGAVG